MTKYIFYINGQRHTYYQYKNQYYRISNLNGSTRAITVQDTDFQHILLNNELLSKEEIKDRRVTE
jgi:hypothetical protein